MAENPSPITAPPPSSSGSAIKGKILQFTAFQGSVDDGFFRRLSSLKLDTLGLDHSPIPITGFYAPCSHAQVPNPLKLMAESLPDDPSGQFPLIQAGVGNRNKCPVPGTLYNTNTLESFHSLDRETLLNMEGKKVFDDIISGKADEDSAVLSRFLIISFADLKKWTFHCWFAFPALSLDPPATLINIQPAAKVFSSEEAKSLSTACNEWRNSNLTAGLPFFLVHIASNAHVTIRPLKDFEASHCDGGKLLFGFYDPCNLPSNPGWALRNFLAFICLRWEMENIHFLCYREKHGMYDIEFSLVGEAVVMLPQGWRDPHFVPKAIGWDLKPKIVNLASSMDPERSPNTNVLSSVKCMLLGVGTLGCQVARMLMDWGIRRITLLDSGHVAMSNPVRQSLYTFEDCLNGGEMKAVAAAKSLKRIFPTVEAEGIDLAIPMPGHPVPAQEVDNVLKDCERLQSLIASHDVVFLLTDTRESRWLPTLLCVYENKSTFNRTLDQQCTVTRPGLASIASSFAVELLVGILHHPKGINAPGESASSIIDSSDMPLGILPHQMRGSLHQFSQLKLVGYASKCCTACSDTVVSEYRRRGMEFVLQAINQPTYLEDLTGLTEPVKAANSFNLNWDEAADADDAIVDA